MVILALGKSCSHSSSDASATAGSHIAVVDIVGTIAADKQSVNSSNTIKSLKKAFENKQSKAVVLNINSPGGSPVQSDEIWQEIQYLKKSAMLEKTVCRDWRYRCFRCLLYCFSCGRNYCQSIESGRFNWGDHAELWCEWSCMQKLGVEDRTMTSGEKESFVVNDSAS